VQAASSDNATKPTIDLRKREKMQLYPVATATI
jgi:hypothetical protein